jgi:formylglycine-generating enzyme required for sulfatase activity
VAYLHAWQAAGSAETWNALSFEKKQRHCSAIAATRHDLMLRESKQIAADWPCPIFHHIASDSDFCLVPGFKEPMPDGTFRYHESFFAAIAEVTQREWIRAMGTNPSVFVGTYLPVDSVTFEAAKEYCERLGLSLPTSDEWSQLCPDRATGSDPVRQALCNLADATLHVRRPTLAHLADLSHLQIFSDEIDDMFAGTAPCRSFPPNDMGLCDVYGNLWEWTTPGDESGIGMLRGGSWANPAQDIGRALAAVPAPRKTAANVGFRPILRL